MSLICFPRSFSTAIAAGLIGLFLLGTPITNAVADSGFEDPNTTWIPKGIDWSKAKEVTIELDDDLFEPDEVVFKKGIPYHLILNNVGEKPHDLVDLGFYHAIVTSRISAGTGTVKTPHIHSLYLRKQGRVSVYFVPVKAGEYQIYCSVPGHRENGMEGDFIIE